MSDIQFDTHDQSVVAQLKQLVDGTTAGEYFARALELKATPVLLACVASTYTTRSDDGYTIVGLPYVGAMLDAGRSNADVRTVLETLCSDEEYEDIRGSHREGFWNDPDTWSVFDDADTFVAFMQQFAASSDGARRVLTEDGHTLLESALAMWRDTPQEYQRDVRAIESVAARHLTFIADEYQLRQMIRYAVTGRDKREVTRKQAAMACNLGHWGWNVVFRGFVLAKLAVRSSEYGSVIDSVYQMFQMRPEWAPATFRWLAEGFWHANHEYWEWELFQGSLANTFAYHGWHIVTVPEGYGRLVHLEHNGRRISVRDVPANGGDSIFDPRNFEEELHAGDRVIIHVDQLKGLTGRDLPGGGRGYEMPLTPARRPTPEQLANPKAVFVTKRK